MKYVIVDFQGLELPIVFSEAMPHVDAAKGQKVISAGFCSKNAFDGHWKVFGLSEGLRLSSRPEDSYVIQKGLEFGAAN